MFVDETILEVNLFHIWCWYGKREREKEMEDLKKRIKIQKVCNSNIYLSDYNKLRSLCKKEFVNNDLQICFQIVTGSVLQINSRYKITN